MPDLEGLLILDKPAGYTSREVVERVKKMLGTEIAGHVGTLDPNATGVLPILLGRATRIARVLERLDKEYVATVHLHKDVSDSELRDALKSFVGEIKQRPPVKSAVARRERPRKVYSIEVLDIERHTRDVTLRIACEAGTYIRKLASDLGAKVGGAHLKELRRTKAGPFEQEKAHTMILVQMAVRESHEGDDSPLRRIILPVERAVEHMPKVIVSDSAIPRVLNGSPIKSGVIEIVGKVEKGELVAIMSQARKLIALGRFGPTIHIDRVLTEK